jgi:predicted amidohydrolase YtcJ
VQHSQPAERLTVTSAFDAATRGAHWAGLADDAGVIRAGSAASMAIWDIGDADLDGPAPLPQLDEDALPTCIATISSGQVIYRSESFAVG